MSLAAEVQIPEWRRADGQSPENQGELNIRVKSQIVHTW
jgi:hypothetical protein